MSKKIIIKGDKGWALVLKTLNIKTNIPLNKIGAIYKGKIYEDDLFSIIQLVEDMKK